MRLSQTPVKHRQRNEVDVTHTLRGTADTYLVLNKKNKIVRQLWVQPISRSMDTQLCKLREPFARFALFPYDSD